MASKPVRTVRFAKEELKAIDQFLEQNPFFDFSSLTRIAITAFLKEPRLSLRAVKNKPKPLKNRQKETTL